MESDDKVSRPIQELWNDLWKEIVLLEEVRIARWIGTENGTETKLIGFADSSQKAFGAVIYARTENPNGSIQSHLVTSKTRVVPLKNVTIPRLELSAAESLSRLLTNISVSMEFKDTEYILWTDSSITLYWIRKQPGVLKQFVANRVASIQKRTDLKCWRYVNTKENPADLLSRGARPSELGSNKLWWHGPAWLSLPESQ